MEIIASLAIGIAQALPTLIPQMVEVVVQMVQTLVDNLPLILDAALQLIEGLAQGILDAIPVLIEALPEVIMGIVNFLLDSIPEIIETGITLLDILRDPPGSGSSAYLEKGTTYEVKYKTDYNYRFGLEFSMGVGNNNQFFVGTYAGVGAGVCGDQPHYDR